MDGTISFDSNSLQTYNRTTQIGIITDYIDLDSPGVKDLSMYALAHANSTTIAAGDTPNKVLPITGTIKSDTAINLDTLLDTFKGYFNGRDKNLDIGYKGAVRRYTASENGLTITRSQNKKYARFSLNFVCTSPFGISTAATTALSATGRTASGYTDSHTFIGSAPSQLPVITITLTAVSASGSQQLFWGNNDTGQSISVTRNTWTAGDVIIIDCRAGGSVTVNGIPIDFTGAFPEFTAGAHGMIYGDTFTTRTFNIGVVYNARYR